MFDYVLAETRKMIIRKWPDAMPEVERFFSLLPHILVPDATDFSPGMISDPKDAPSLATAKTSSVDIIISGDHHFIELARIRHRIMTAQEFWEEFGA